MQFAPTCIRQNSPASEDAPGRLPCLGRGRPYTGTWSLLGVEASGLLRRLVVGLFICLFVGLTSGSTSQQLNISTTKHLNI